MFMSCVSVLISYLIIEVLCAPTQTPDRTPSLLKPSDLSKPNQPSDNGPDPPCEDGKCRSSQNLVGPIVGAVCGVLASVIIGIVVVWFYFKRKNQKSKEIIKTPEVKFIEFPSLYTDAISTTDSVSKLYGMSSSRNNSITSHYYDKIHYNEPS